MTIPTLKALLVQELSDILAAEVQLRKTLPKMAAEATFEPLKEMIGEWQSATAGRIDSLERLTVVIENGIMHSAANQVYDLRCQKALSAGSPAMVKDFQLIVVLNTIVHERMGWYENVHQVATCVNGESSANPLWALYCHVTVLDRQLAKVMNKMHLFRVRQSPDVAEVDSR